MKKPKSIAIVTSIIMGLGLLGVAASPATASVTVAAVCPSPEAPYKYTSWTGVSYVVANPKNTCSSQYVMFSIQRSPVGAGSWTTVAGPTDWVAPGKYGYTQKLCNGPAQTYDYRTRMSTESGHNVYSAKKKITC